MQGIVTENYLKAIYHLSQEGKNGVTTNSIAESLDIKAPTVSDMLKKLRDKDYITYKKYKGVNLTKKGKKVAVNTIRKHRIWEVFLVDKLKFKWDEVHAIAEQLEHIQSVELVDRLDTFLGKPKFDPHGDPIPDSSGNIVDNRKIISLSEMEVGKKGIIAGVNDTSVSFLQFLDKLNINLGSRVELLNRFDYDSTVEIKQGTNNISLSKKAADNIFLKIS